VIADVFLDQKRVNVCEHTIKMAPRDGFRKVPLEGCKTGRGEEHWREWREN
jgi:hypothetical protein